jgi:hypothetical protein
MFNTYPPIHTWHTFEIIPASLTRKRRRLTLAGATWPLPKLIMRENFRGNSTFAMHGERVKNFSFAVVNVDYLHMYVGAVVVMCL